MSFSLTELSSCDPREVEPGKMLARRTMKELNADRFADDHDSSTAFLLNYYQDHIQRPPPVNSRV